MVLSGLLSPFNISLPVSSKIVRLGTVNTGVVHIIKLFCNKKQDLSILLSNFNNAKLSGVVFLVGFRLVHDKTLLQRQLLKSCLNELERRSNSGKKDRLIEFLDRNSIVISGQSKNGDSQRRRLIHQPKLPLWIVSFLIYLSQ